jgi:hypothetical protein
VKRVLSSVRLVPPRSCGRPRPTCRAPGIWLLRAHPRLWCRQCKHTTRNDPADAAPSWSGCSTAPSSSPPTPSSVRAGGSPGRPPPTAASPRHRTATPTDWAGSCSAAPFLRTRSCTIGVASMPAGIPTICRWSPMPRTWGSSARRIASTGTRCRVTTSGLTPGREHESAGHAFRRANGGFGQRRAEPRRAIQAQSSNREKLTNLVARTVDLVLSSSALLTALSWDDATRSWEPAGCSPGQLTPMGGLVKTQSDSSTAWAGSSYAVRYPTAWSCTIGVASMPAGIPTICSSLPTPRIWRTGARRTASADTRCQAPTYGSTQGLERGAAVSAAPHTSERFASATRSARRRPSDHDDEMRRDLASPITFVMLTNPLLYRELPLLRVERHVDVSGIDVSGNVMLLSVNDDTSCQ